jgi:hypothetical protein
MKRAFTEWGLVVSLVILVAIGVIWVGSLFVHYFREPLYLGTELYVRIEASRLCIFSELGADWKPRLDERVEPRAISWVRVYNNWLFPGLEYHNRLFANGRTVWSLEMSLIVPVCFLLTTMAILWRVRLGGWLPRKSVNEH